MLTSSGKLGGEMDVKYRRPRDPVGRTQSSAVPRLGEACTYKIAT
jgi:hypothetical protein